MKKNIPLIVGIALPIVFVVVISLVIFIPSLFIRPHYDFLYSTEYPVSTTDYGYNQKTYLNDYTIINGHIALEPISSPTTPSTPPTPLPATSPRTSPVITSSTPNNQISVTSPTLFLYDIKTDSSHEISYTDAQKYLLDPGPSSADGYIVKYEYSNNGIFDIFGSNSDTGGYFVEKAGSKKKLGGISDVAPYSYGYEGGFKLIGWIQ